MKADVHVQAEQLQLTYLEAEFACIDVLLRREVRRWEVAGQDPNDDYRGLYITQTEAVALLDLPFGVSWGQSIQLPTEEEETFSQAYTIACQRVKELAHTLTTQNIQPRLQQIASAFELDRIALNILLLCLAPAFATRYERVYGYLQDNVTRRRPTVRLVLQLLGEPGMAQYALAEYLGPEAPLFQHHLIEAVTEAPPANVYWINQTLQVDEGVASWLRGEYRAVEVLGEQARLQRQPHPSPPLLREGTVAGRGKMSALDRGELGHHTPIWSFYGVDSEQQRGTAEGMAEAAGQPLLTVYLNKIINDSCPALQAVRMALRDARLTGAIAFLCGWDACLNGEETVEAALLTALCEHPGMVIVAGQKRWQPSGIERQRPFFQRSFEMPNYEQRLVLWHRYWETVKPKQIAKMNVNKEEAEKPLVSQSLNLSISLPDLAAQFALTTSQIRDAVASAQDRASQAERNITAEDLFAAARGYSNPRLTALARKITPRYHWEDIILPADEREKLQETVAAIRHRNKVLDEWGIGEKLASGRGVMMLFSGPPGTGKTMAAEVVAAELRLDLYKIDLSGVVSKYIGETEKNLERIFSEAHNSNAILFFDEADAIFGKRSEVKDAHDRYANLEVAYLLQRMESYEGITILATNMRANLDEAFLRRFHSTVDFPFPKRAERLHIWKTLFPTKLERDESVDFNLLANRFELAGGNIRNIIVAAAYLAANNGNVVTMEHLLHGARREMQKMGRLVGDAD